MLAKFNRLNRAECDFLLQEKNLVFHTPSLFVRAIPAEEFKAAVAVSKKVSKKAVDRNRMRRVVYDALFEYKNLPAHILISVKKGAKNSDSENIRAEIKGLREKIERSFS